MVVAFRFRVWVFWTRIVGSGGFTAEKIARATRSGLASIFGMGFGGRPRGRGLMTFFVMSRDSLRHEIWLGNWRYMP